MEYLFVISSMFVLLGSIMMAKGLFISPYATLNQGQSFWGFNPDLITHTMQDKSDAILGSLSLVLGFGLQLIAYLLPLFQKDITVNYLTSVPTRLLLCCVPIILYIIVWLLCRKPLTLFLVLRVSRYLKKGNNRETLLIRAAIILGDKPADLQGEHKIQFIKEVFGKKAQNYLDAPDPEH